MIWHERRGESDTARRARPGYVLGAGVPHRSRWIRRLHGSGPWWVLAPGTSVTGRSRFAPLRPITRARYLHPRAMSGVAISRISAETISRARRSSTHHEFRVAGQEPFV